MNEAARAADPRGPRYRLLSSGLALSALSFVLVLYTASAEPFIVFGFRDLVFVYALIAAGAVVFALFATWAGVCVWHSSRALRTGRGALLVCSAVLWTALNLFYLGNVIYGCFADLSNPYLPRFRWEP